MESPWSSVGSYCSREDDEREEGVLGTGEASSQQQQQGTVEANAQQNQQKRPRLGAGSSSGRKSEVWNYFKIIPTKDANEVEAECMSCHKVLKAKSQNGTSSLLRHLKNSHSTNRTEVSNCSLNSEKNGDGPVAHGDYTFDQNCLRTGIATFLLGGSHPLTVVEEHGFRNMLSLACPQFEQVSRHTMRSEIIAMFDKERKDMIEALSNSPGRVSFTSNNWKSDCQKYNYICITAHYIDSNWKLHKTIIRCTKLNPPIDGACIADEVHFCFREWKIDSKIMCMTLDNASYNDKMITTLKTQLMPKGVLPLSGTFFQVRCCAHILSLVVKDGLKLIEKSVDKLRDGIQYIEASPERMRKFYDIAEQIFQLDVKNKLHVDIPVRWDSTCKMISTALYFYHVLVHFSQRDTIFKSEFMLSPEEWDKVDTMNKFLKTIYDATLIFSGTQYPTSNLYLKALVMVHSHLLEALTKSENFMTPMLKSMKENFEKYWTDYNVILSCAAVLDPRHKLQFVSNCYEKLYGHDAQRHVDEIRQTLQTLFDDGYQGIGGPDTSKSNRIQGKSQLDIYLDEPTKTIDEKLDVLDYWSKTSARYPELALMARDVLAIPVSFIDSESAFSTSLKVIAYNQSSPESKTIEALVCLQDWYRARMHEGSATVNTKESDETTAEVDEEASDSKCKQLDELRGGSSTSTSAGGTRAPPVRCNPMGPPPERPLHLDGDGREQGGASGGRNANQYLDERARKVSNRLSARRSQLRRQRHLDELVQEIARLRAENASVAACAADVAAQHALVEQENTVLRARVAELRNRLRSFNDDVLRVVAMDIQGELPADDPLLRPWQLP